MSDKFKSDFMKMIESGEDDGILIDPNDFVSMEIIVGMKNLTAKTEIRDGRRIFGEKDTSEKGVDYTIHFIEFLEKNEESEFESLVIEAPKRNCAEGHLLNIDLEVKGAKETFELDLESRVEVLEKTDGDTDRITVSILNVDEVAWQQFKSLFSNRQEEILAFFEAVKGG